MSAKHTIQPGWFSLEGAAIYTGFSVPSIRKAAKLGMFPAWQVHITGSTTKSVRIKRDHLDAWIEACPIIGETALNR